MNFAYDFIGEAKALGTRKNSLSGFLAFIYNWFGRIGFWIFGPMVVDTAIVLLVMYFAMRPEQLEVFHVIIMLVAVVALLFIIGYVVRYIYRSSKGKAGIIYSEQRIINILQIENNEVKYSLNKFNKTQDSTEKVYALNYILLSIEDAIDVVEEELDRMNGKMQDIDEGLKAIYNSEYEYIESLYERLVSKYNDMVKERKEFIKENNLNIE